MMLYDKTFMELVKKELKVQGGVSLVASVNTIMYRIMTDSLAVCFTYKGVPARFKSALKVSKLVKLIFEVIHGRASLAYSSKKEVGKVVDEWLRLAGARIKRSHVVAM